MQTPSRSALTGRSAPMPRSHLLKSQLVQLSTGPLIHYVEQGDPSGEPVIFIHGWPDSWFSFSAMLAQLPPEYHAFALDLRGFGNSERPKGSYSIDQFAADIAAFIDAMDTGPATLVGHSMGSFIARRVAEQFPSHVKRLVLIGSAVSPVNAVTLDVYGMVQQLADPICRTFVREFQASTLHTPVSEPFFEGLVAESLKAPARVWQGALDGLLALDDADALRQIAAPTLILWGQHDGLFASLDEQDRLASMIPGARLTVYPDAGHSPNWELPEQLTNDLTTFIRATPLPSRQAARDQETSS